MKLKATIAVEIEAADFLEAAAHQKRLEGLIEQMRSDYPGAALNICERRSPRGAGRIAQASRRLPLSGRLARYVD